jgi:hypothetical protein
MGFNFERSSMDEVEVYSSFTRQLNLRMMRDKSIEGIPGDADLEAEIITWVCAVCQDS